MPLKTATNASFEDENEGGNVADSKADSNSGDIANAVEAKVIDDHVKQETTDGVALLLTAKYNDICIHLDLISLDKSCFRLSE
ncbi:hypothetical protein MAM1_0324c09675 [Mucor ambiguus]|uniref:Uncharacterized protein n=1 Tax=Mucor ambiguus TaxID=91626 RepID=A0A0C9N6B7_9FUNG|nr:hypothetical protein MAM1_0324c09675 [Mucor ambiguus]